MAVMDWLLGRLQAAGLDAVTSAWVYITAAGALCAGCCLWYPLFRLRHQISYFLRYMADLPPRMPANVEVIDRYFADRRGTLAECWRAYRQACNDPMLQWPEGRYPDVLTFFPSGSLIEREGRRRLAEAVPGLLTAFGILGTFVGLSVGLRGLTIANVEGIRSSIHQLLGGMQVAFLSSVAAVFCSIVWLLLDRAFIGGTVAVMDRLHDRLLLLVPTPGESELLQQLLAAQREHTSTMKSFINDFILPKVVDGFTAIVQESLVPEVARTAKTVAEALPGVAATFQEVVESSIAPHLRQTAAAVEEFVRAGTAKELEGLQEMTTHFLRALDGQVRDNFDNLALLVRELMDASGKLAGDATTLVQRMEDLAVLNESVASRMGDMLSVLGAYAEEFRRFHALLDATLNGMNEVTEQVRGVEAQFTEQVSAMSTIQGSLNETWRQLSNELQPRIAELSGVWEESRRELAELNESLEHSTEAFASNLHAGLSRSFDAFDEGLARATRHLAGTLGQMNETVEDVADQIGRFGGLLAGLSEGLTRLQELAPGMVEALSRLGQTVDQLLAASYPQGASGE